MKTVKRLLAVLLCMTLVLGGGAVANAAEENWVQIKTSGDALEKGDYYVDLTSMKDEYIERYIYENLSDNVYMKDAHWSPNYPTPDTFNNLEIAGVEKLVGLYPDLWQEALQEVLAVNPDWEIDDFYTIQDAWSVFSDKIFDQELVEGLRYWQDLGDYGLAYLSETYPATLAQVEAEAADEFEKFEKATYSYDSAFAGYHWLKAELDGEELRLSEDIYEYFTVYGAEWLPVAADEASVGDEGGWYFNGKSIEVPVNEEYINSVRESGEWMYENLLNSLPTDYHLITGEVRYITTAEELRAVIDDSVEAQIADYMNRQTSYYEHYFDRFTPYVNADEDELFSLKLVQTITDPTGNTYSYNMYLPLAEHTWMDSGITAEKILACISYREPVTPDDPTPDEPVTPDDPTPDEPSPADDEAKNGECPYCGETHDKKTLSGFLTALLHYIMYVLYQFRSLFGAVRKAIN